MRSYRAAVVAAVAVLLTTVAASTAVFAAPSFVRVTADHQGGEPDGFSGPIIVSDDGRYVAFYSSAADLTPSDLNGSEGDVFRWDRTTGDIEIASIASTGGQIQPTPFWGLGNNVLGMSDDGSRIIFRSFGEVIPGIELPSDPNPFCLWCLGGRSYVRDMGANTTELVDQSTSGTPGNNGRANSVSISGDSRYVVFGSTQDNLVAGDTNTYMSCGDDCVLENYSDVFIRDLQLGTTERLSLGNGGAQLNGGSVAPAINDDGSLVAYWSCATNGWGDADGNVDLIVHDRSTGENHWIVELLGSCGSGDPSMNPPVMSADGHHVAFNTAEPLVPGDSGFTMDIYALDWTQPIPSFEWIGHNLSGQPADNSSQLSTVGGPGARYVAFTSHATDLISQDSNGSPDAFIYDRLTGTTKRVSVSANGVEANDHTFEVDISEDGSAVVLVTDASNIFPENPDFDRDILLVSDWQSLPDEPLSPAVSIDPPDFDFGVWQVGSSGPGFLVVTNTGAGSLAISSIEYPTLAEFHAGAGTTCTGVAIPPGGSCEIEVRFEPLTDGFQARNPNRVVERCQLAGPGAPERHR